MFDDVSDVLQLVRDEAAQPSRWLDLSDWKARALAGLAAMVVLAWGWRRTRRFLRRRRRPRLHPKLQKYAGAQPEDPKMVVKRRSEAERILATSSGVEVIGYDVVEQLEAVFVDGFARPEDALQGLKAVAAMKGANAVTNVRQRREVSGVCSASGDAVVVHRLGSMRDGSATDPHSSEKLGGSTE